MPIFWHNPLAEMYGPEFLALYLLVIVAIIGFCLYLRYSRDSSSSLPPLRVPANPDPYEIAYLRGGANEVVRLAIYKLLKLGFLIIEPLVGRSKKSNAQQIRHSEQAPDPAHLDPIDAEMMSYFESPATTAALFKSGLPKRIENLCKPYLSSLAHEHLLSPPDGQSKMGPVRLLGSAAIVLFGGYKLIA